MKLKKIHWIGIILFLLIIIISTMLFLHTDLFYFLIGISFLLLAMPFVLDLVLTMGKTKEKEEMFVEFIRALVESVRAGTPIPKAIINVSYKDYRALTPHTMKLANQISLGIPVRRALMIFAYETKSDVIARAVELISQAERAGGRIDTVLESVLKSITQIEELKNERKAGVYSMVMQGYMIFIIFIVIMVVVQFKFIPLMQGTLQGVGGAGPAIGGMQFGKATVPQQIMDKMFLALMIIQGLFAGLVIGKLSEGNVKSGLKHSAIFVAMAYLITTGAKILMT